MNVGFYAGSFSPFTNGHLHVVKQASKLFDKVIIGIGINSQNFNLWLQFGQCEGGETIDSSLGNLQPTTLKNDPNNVPNIKKHNI